MHQFWNKKKILQMVTTPTCDMYRFVSIAFYAGFWVPLVWFGLAKFLRLNSIENEENHHSRCTLLVFVNKFRSQISSILNSFVSELDRIKYCNERMCATKMNDKTTKHRRIVKWIWWSSHLNSKTFNFREKSVGIHLHILLFFYH